MAGQKPHVRIKFHLRGLCHLLIGYNFLMAAVSPPTGTLPRNSENSSDTENITFSAACNEIRVVYVNYIS